MADLDANCSEDSPLPIENQYTFDVRNLLKVNEKGVLKWEGNFEELKSFLDSFLKTNTKWSSPRGNCKQYQAENGLDIRWYLTSKSLCIDGPAGDSLKTQLTILVNNIEQESVSIPEATDEPSSFQMLNHANNIHDCDASNVSLQKITEIIRRLEERMNERMAELSHEIKEIKLDSLHSTRGDTDISQDSIRNVIQENASLKNQNKDLKERCENLVYVMGALKRDLNNLEEEKKSLLTVIKLIQADAEKLQQKPNEHQNNWNKVKERSVQKHKNTYKEMQISNTVEIQSDSDDNISSPETPKSQKQKNGDKRPARVNKDSDQRIRRSRLNSAVSNKSTAQNQETEINGNASSMEALHPNSSTRTIIAGDSMIKNLNGYKMSTKNSRVQVSTFPGCSTLDMEDHIKPILRKKPDKLVIHVGTNSLRETETPEKCADEISNLAKMVLSSSPETTVALSSIITRIDDKVLAAKAFEVNLHLKQICQQNHWIFINHSNIKSNHLNRSGIHLNKAGTLIMARNFTNIIYNKNK